MLAYMPDYIEKTQFVLGSTEYGPVNFNPREDVVLAKTGQKGKGVEFYLMSIPKSNLNLNIKLYGITIKLVYHF